MYKKENLRVFLLSETFYPPEIGGLELYASRLAKQLSEKGIDISVITRKTNLGLKSFEKIGNVSVRRISPHGVLKGKGWKAFFPILFLIGKVFSLLIKKVNQYDLLLVISFKVLSIPAAIVKSIFGKRCVVVIVSPSELQQDILSNESLSKMNIARYSLILKLIKAIRDPLIRKNDCFVVKTQEMKKLLNDFGIDSQIIRIIPNGVDSNIFNTVPHQDKIKIRKKLFLPEDKIIFCYAGRIVHSKGVMLLARVWKDLMEKHKNIYLLLVGSGKNSYDNCEDELLQYISNNKLDENVYITGFVNNVDEYLKSSDIFVFPSFYEGFGQAIIEAFTCQLPSIVTKVGVARELIQDYKNGISININNHQELQGAIEWMIQHKEFWKEIGKNAGESVKKFSMDAETDQYIRMFNEI